MADNIIDSPILRITKDYEKRLRAKQKEIDDLQTKINTVRGINEMLKLEILNLENTIMNLNNSVVQATEHVKKLKNNLPEDLDNI
jgi:peptidoglycan hydrolase CwlO-like protein